MNVIALTADHSPDLANALTQFEMAFSYPLGAQQRFRIDHGADYLRFFRAMGEAQCFVAMAHRRIIGTVSVVVRRLITPVGQSQLVAYIGDLKIAAEARGGWALIKLARSAAAWARQHTRLLSAGRYAVPAADPALRSDITPFPVALPNCEACGFIEDTRRAKRLIVDGGKEMLSAHLSHFAYRTPADGARLLNVARGQAARLGFPALFFASSKSDAGPILDALAAHDSTVTTATVYGCGLPNNAAWNINTSEI